MTTEFARILVEAAFCLVAQVGAWFENETLYRIGVALLLFMIAANTTLVTK